MRSTMVALRSSYRPARRAPPVANGFVLWALACTSATSNVAAGGELVDWPEAAAASSVTKMTPANVRLIPTSCARRLLPGLGSGDSTDEREANSPSLARSAPFRHRLTRSGL